jgi:hypothetical protein
VSPVAALALIFAQMYVAREPELPPRPRLAATRTTQPPVIDGKLDDPAWRAAAVSDTFTQHFPAEGAPPSERTELRVLYDDRNIYVGVDCHQTSSPIVRRLQRRDGPLPSDGVWIDIDSRRDGVSAFHFSINAAGALADGIHYDDTSYSTDWDAVWEAKVADTGHGYSIEFRIPLSALRFSKLPVQDWGFQVRRFIDARQETDDWAFYPRTAATYVPLFGRLDNLVDLDPRHPIELRPFVLGRVGHRAADADATLTEGWAAGASAGLDAKLHVTNELSLNLALNPDFGQVEADAAVLNLSTFETFFPEKRPFFLEGMDAFATIRPVVYTRRIGRQPATATLAPDETLVANPDPSPLYGAAKLVGTIGGRTNVGIISAITGANDIDVQLIDGRRERRRVDPWTAFNIARIKRTLAGNTSVGLMATATNRLEAPTAPGALCASTGRPAAPDGRCTNDAYVFSADGRWRSPLGTYAVAWQGIGSALSGGPERPQPDGIPIRPGNAAGSASLYVGKEGGPRWLWNAWQHLTGRTLELNDVGYLERKNDYQGYFTLMYRTLQPWWRTLETKTALKLNLRQTLDGINLWNEVKLATDWAFSSFWWFYFDVHARGPYYDDREAGDGTALERPAHVGVIGDFGSDPRRRVVGGLTWNADVKRGGGVYLQASGRVTLRALPRLELDFFPTASYESGTPRYVSKSALTATTTTYQFGEQTAASVGATVRAAYTFTPTLSLQLYTQLFLARVRYGPFFTHTAAVGARVRIADLGAPTAAVDADTERATLNVNLVLRWEYRLGSTLFVVYTRAQDPALTPGPDGAGFRLNPILQGRAADNVLMVKLAYWFG